MPSSTCEGIRDTDQDPELNNCVFHFPSPCSFPLKGDKHCLNFAFSSALYCLLIGPFSKRWQEDVISSLKAVIWGLHLSPYSSGGSMLNAATLRSFANASPEAALPTPRGRQFLTGWTILGPTRCWATFPAYVFFFFNVTNSYPHCDYQNIFPDMAEIPLGVQSCPWQRTTVPIPRCFLGISAIISHFQIIGLSKDL